MSLLEKMRRAREQRVEVGGFVFTVRRPTVAEVLTLGGALTTAVFPRFVVGWDGVRELDLVPGGGPDPVPFDADACAEWLQDRPDLLGPLAERVAEAYRAHRDALEAAEKN